VYARAKGGPWSESSAEDGQLSDDSTRAREGEEGRRGADTPEGGGSVEAEDLMCVNDHTLRPLRLQGLPQLRRGIKKGFGGGREGRKSMEFTL